MLYLFKGSDVASVDGSRILMDRFNNNSAGASLIVQCGVARKLRSN